MIDDAAPPAIQTRRAAERLWQRRKRAQDRRFDELTARLDQVHDPESGGPIIPDLAGDVSGPPLATVVGKILGRPISTIPPTNGQLYAWIAAAGEWRPVEPAEVGGFDNPMTSGGDMIVGAPAGTLLNVALTSLGATASASIPTASGSNPNLGIDGNLATAWSAASGATDAVYTVDLSAAQSITHFRFVQLTGGGHGMNDYVIESSLNGSDWTTRKTMSGQVLVPDSGEVALDSGANARYWRISATGSGLATWAIYALELYTGDEGRPERLPGADAVGRVLTWSDDGPAWAPPVGGGGGGGSGSSTNKALTALGAVATASSTYSVGFGSDPDFGFDGDDATWWASEFGTNVAGEWLAVDLGAAFTIAQFRVYQQWQADFGASSSKIQSSPDNATWTDRHTLSAFGDTGLLDLSSGPVTARYWRILGVSGPSGGGNYWRINSLELHVAGASGGAGADLSGFSWKQAVRAASTANVALATAVENGDTLDGVTLATGDRVLLKDQTTASENGVYIVNATGAPTRATDFDAGAEVAGAIVAVREGTANANTAWQMITDGSITIGTTGLTFSQFGAGAAGLTVQELDGAPSGAPATLKFPNGTLTNNGDGSFTYTPPTAGKYAQYVTVLDGAGDFGFVKLPDGSPVTALFSLE